VTDTVWLNVLRHPQQPINRRDASWEQFIDPAWQDANDDIHPTLGPAQVAAGVQSIRVDPCHPLLIAHSPYRRSRRGAELLAGHFRDHTTVELRELDALREADIVWPEIMTRDEYNDPARPATLAFERIMQAIATDEGEVVRGGRAAIAEQVQGLRDLLESGEYTNHIWVTHAPIMPFIHMAIVDIIPPERWTVERAMHTGMTDFSTGFSVEIAVERVGERLRLLGIISGESGRNSEGRS
jgi:broad specificity phosphatase PhoE